jgi:CHAD domain-containing protein
MSAPRSTPALKPREPLQSGFLRPLRAFASEARRLTRPSERNRPTALHDARILIKHLRALLWLAQPVLDHAIRTESKRHLRQAAKLLAKPRDLDVAKETLKKLARQTSDSDDLKALSEIRHTLHPSGSPPLAALIHHALERVSASLPPLRQQAKTASLWPQPSDRLAKARRLLHRGAKKAKHTGKSIRHHEWRKKAKRLLYLFEFIHPHPDEPTAHLIHRLDQLQNTLGKSHDCAITRDHLPRKAKRICRLLRHREKHFQAKAAHQASYLQ